MSRGEDSAGEARERGRRIMRSQTAVNFELGDLLEELLAVWPRGQDQAGVLAEFAAQLGCSESSLRSYRRVARAWPAQTRRADVPWTVYRELAGLPDRFALISPERSGGPGPATRARGHTVAALQAGNGLPDAPAT
jgi:hypothetical protein